MGRNGVKAAKPKSGYGSAATRKNRNGATSTVPASIELDRFLPYRFAVLSTAISRALGEVYGDRFGLTIADWRILANLGQTGALYAGELAERSSLDKPKVTRALQRMEASGIIIRAIDLEDRRQARLSLTEKGQRMYREVAELAIRWEAELLAPLDEVDRAAFGRVLEKLQSRVGDMRRDYAAGQQKAALERETSDDETL